MPPPVKITVGPDGKLIVSSEDAQALDRLEDLAAQLAVPRKDYRIFHLKYAWAVGVAMNLEDFFKEEKKERPRMPWWYGDYAIPRATRKTSGGCRSGDKVTFISDSETNTILVEGASAEQLKTIEDLIQLYDQPPPSDAQSVRKTEIIRLKYSKAKAVADTVKEVYRDLLSANDKALADNQKRDTARNFVFNYGGTDKRSRRPRNSRACCRSASTKSPIPSWFPRPAISSTTSPRWSRSSMKRRRRTTRCGWCASARHQRQADEGDARRDLPAEVGREAVGRRTARRQTVKTVEARHPRSRRSGFGRHGR